MKKQDEATKPGSTQERGGLVDPLVMRLRAMARYEHDDLSIGDEAADRIIELEDMLFVLGAMEQSPCFLCGYNGSGYYQPDMHKCAERHHRLRRDSCA